MASSAVPIPNRATQSAHATLQGWYAHLEQQRGTHPTADEFYPLHVEALVPVLTGWRVERVPFIFGETVHGQCDFEGQRILVPIDVQSDERARFSLAHELAHVLLHRRNPQACGTGQYRGQPRSVRYLTSKPPDVALEREADRFATELLMPSKAVRKQFNERYGTDRIWSGSSTVRQALAYEAKRPRFSDPATPSVLQAAAALAGYTSDTSRASLTTYFGVSRTALAIRLVELELIY